MAADRREAPHAAAMIGWLRRRLGVRLRSALAASAVVAVAVAVAAVAFVLTARVTLVGNLDGSARQRAAEVADAVAANDQDRLADVLRPGPADQTVVQILDPSGRVLAASTQLPGAPALSPLRPAPGQTLRGEAMVPRAGEDPFRIVAIGVRSPQGQRTVLVGQSMRPVNDTIEVVTAILSAGMPILLVISGVATFLFVGRSLRPVEAIRRRVAGITARDLHARVPVPPVHDEVAALAETMNGMLDRLETAASSQRRFVADASHELRSPLATVQAGLEMLAAGPPLPDGAGHHVQLMRAETERLGRLVADLLLLGRVDEHGLSLNRDDVDLDDLAYTERDRLAARHPELVVATQISPVRVIGDVHHLARAVRNLSDNAARHAIGRVTLRVWSDARHGHLEVVDDGPGVPPADRERIFERFVRLDDSRSRADGGTGLGLPITREIVTAHGGTVTLLPESPSGGGLTVRLSLPVAVLQAGLSLDA